MGCQRKVSPSTQTSNTFSSRHFMPHSTCSEREATNSGMNYIHLTTTLVESFNALADEVQILTDRKTILEHKLRFAHEQYQYLADKHAPAAPEISEVLAKLQLPPELANPSLEDANPVPLPKRNKLDTRNQIALIIRDGRRVAQQLTSIGETSKTSDSSRETSSREAQTGTSMSTVLEQDFTIEGKKGPLECPFSSQKADSAGEGDGEAQNAEKGSQDPTPHHSADPICAAMFEESTSQPAPGAADSPAKCPIRYLDQHSPEEIAHYVETHKHELPRSHEVCVRRYQKNEVQIKKLDAKYGNLVNMIQGLSALHQPMLPESQQEQEEIERASNERVHNWAKAVTDTTVEDAEQSQPEPEDADEARQSHFDRTLKEVRVGESPSRPWGISVPIYEPHGMGDEERPLSPPPAPVFMPSGSEGEETPAPKTKTGKCPFDHTKMAAMAAAREEAQPVSPTPAPKLMSNEIGEDVSPPKPAGKCPFDHAQLAAMGFASPPPNTGDQTFVHPEPDPQPIELPSTPVKPQPSYSAPPQQPTFINPPLDANKQYTPNGVPQMVFTGPVFIGYPIEQAIQFMQHFQGRQ
ncbi:hypothetical protein CTAM01_00230 [Colletotrichum tamarilloi]|uniref:Uncharacterized protein n=1 Tax=Colletotrichum tamarilloi TaxID=1209934 RepID=A0ABQ9RUM0_9PEZI|nr:uncharacterized protein CTAM01_00230 [Colletotrichum tamarilloi]KAK1512835.1 hypothetical protein CTAM01_00230 [Colletotrichum tamarilloi]